MSDHGPVEAAYLAAVTAFAEDTGVALLTVRDPAVSRFVHSEQSHPVDGHGLITHVPRLEPVPLWGFACAPRRARPVPPARLRQPAVAHRPVWTCAIHWVGCSCAFRRCSRTAWCSASAASAGSGAAVPSSVSRA